MKLEELRKMLRADVVAKPKLELSDAFVDAGDLWATIAEQRLEAIRKAALCKRCGNMRSVRPNYANNTVDFEPCEACSK